ncbi:MAG: DUF3289 family protein [Clostridia bacterium]|nr:DUF3289 family protein [Clostridia bacterium]
MINKNYHSHKKRVLYKSVIITLLFSLLLTSFPGYAIASTGSSNISTAAPSELNDAVIIAEDTSRRGEFEKHYLLSDGSFVAVSYPEAVHYLNENGTWEEVDNRLSLDSKSSRIINEASNFPVSFANSPTSNSLASLMYNGKVFSWGLSATKLENGKMTQLNTFSSNKANIVIEKNDSLVSAHSKSLSVSNTSVIGKKLNDTDVFTSDKLTGKLGYGNLFEDAPELSVEYSVYHNKIEEDIFINAPTDLRAFTMNIQAGGLVARLNDDGSVDFLDENGNMQYRIGIPYMEDANHEVLNDIEVTVNQKGNNYTVTYTPDAEWLTSDARAYPILLDPSITTKEYNSNIIDTYVYEGNTANHSAEQRLYYGVKSGKVYRIYIKINNLPNIDANMPVLDATMQLNFVSGTTTGKTAQVYKVSSAWNASTLTYANQPSILSSNLLTTCAYNSSLSYLTFDLTQDVTALYDEFQAAVNNGYVVKYGDESTVNPDYNIFHSIESTTTSSRPVITINYGYALPSSLTNGSVYSFQNYGSYSYMTVHNGSNANDVNVYQQDVYPASNLGAQHKFKLEYVPSTGGYYLRAMCSSGGTNRVLDIVKSNGYVNNGGNVQIYAANDPLAQHWFIIGTGDYTFKIVPRTDMSLALTVCPGGDGSSSGTTTTSVGNIFVSTYNDTNDYQKWMIQDENGNLMLGSSQIVQNGTYYLNNKNYGKYLHKSSTYVADAVSGLISTYENTIRWKITHVGNDAYTIQSSDDLTKYLYSGNSTSVSLTTMSSITNNYLWTIYNAPGGGILIQNVATQAYLKQTGTNTVSAASSLGTSGTTAYDSCVWRIASTTFYGNNGSTTNAELSIHSSIPNTTICVGETKSFYVDQFLGNELWCSTASDFSYSITPVGNISISSGEILAEAQGLVTVTATHKVTGRILTFTVTVSNLLVYQTRNRERLGFNDSQDDNDITPIIAEDLEYGEKSTETITSNGTSISMSDLYTNGTIIPLSERIEIIKTFFNIQISYDGTFGSILDEMVDHFVEGSGNDYSNSDLTYAVKTHANTVNYIDGVVDLIKEYLAQNNGDISGLYYDPDLWVHPIQRKNHRLVSRMIDEGLLLPTYGLSNGVPGLTLAINGWHGNKIEIESYTTNGNSYSGTIRVVFYDHFGLDTLDLTEEKFLNYTPGIFSGFRQWYILQHWDSLGATPQPKPYVTIASYTVQFSGTL